MANGGAWGVRNRGGGAYNPDCDCCEDHPYCQHMAEEDDMKGGFSGDGYDLDELTLREKVGLPLIALIIIGGFILFVWNC